MATSTWNSGVSADWDSDLDWSPSPPTGQSTVVVAPPGSCDITIGGTESVTIDNLSLSTAELTIAGALTLDDASAASVIGPQGTLQGGTPTGNGWTVYDDGSLFNQGTISQSGSFYMPNWANTFNNTGVVLAESGAELLLDGQTLTNLQSGILSGGTYDAIGPDSQIDLQSPTTVPTTIVVDNANITLSGIGSEIDGYIYNATSATFTPVALEVSLATIAANGVLNVLGGRDYTAAAMLTDDGLINLAGGSLAAPALSLASGGTLAGFGTVVPNIAGPGLIIAQGGTLALSGGLSVLTSVRVDQGAALLSFGSLGGTIVDNGTIVACNGRLDVTGDVAGSGSFVVAQGSVGSTTTLELSGASSTGVGFGGGFALLRLDQPDSFTGTIAGFVAGDTVDLGGVLATGATLAGSTLDVTTNGTVVDALPVVNAASGLTYSALSDGHGGTEIIATGSGLKFNFTYDPSVASAPAGFEQAMTLAADVLGSVISNPITLNIEVGWGEIEGSSSGFAADGGDADGEGGADNTITLPYSQFKADYIANASDPEQREAAENLPVSDPTNGQGIELSPSVEEAWGLLPANTTLQAGSVGFDSATNWNYGTTYDPSFDDSLVNVALHEITHAMGRADNFLGLFRYTAPGVAQPNDTGPGYFSIDNGTTDLANFDASTGGDPFDWDETYDDSLSVGPDTAIPSFTPRDNTVMNALGFDDNANEVGGIIANSGTAGKTVAAGGSITPFNGMVVSDPLLYDMETLTITTTDAGRVTDDLGTLTDTGGSGITLSETGTGTYSLSAATADALTAALNDLVFTAAAGAAGNETATFTLVVSSPNTTSSTAVTDVTITPTATTPTTTTPTTTTTTPTIVSTGGVIDNTASKAAYTTGAVATTITGGSGSVSVTGGSGGGVFVGGSGGDNVLTATSGNTTMYGGGNADTLTAGTGAGNGTVLVAGPGDETLNGSASTGNIQLFGDAQGGNTLMSAGIGHDTIGTAGASSTVTGPAGGTGLIYLGATHNTVNTNASATLVGGGNNDTISAGVGAMLDYTGASSTEFVGGSSASTLVGGPGNTTMFGGAGGGLIYGGSGSDIIVGGAGSLTMIGGAGGSLAYGGSSGNNLFYAGSGNVSLVGGGNGDDFNVSNSGSNLLVAGGGTEVLDASGSTGSNMIFGGSGYDLVGMGSGSDYFAAGSGSASVTAGSGVDEFIFFNGSAGSTTISGFNGGRDFVALYGYDSGAETTAIAHQSMASGNTTLNLTDGTNITLLDFNGITSNSFV